MKYLLSEDLPCWYELSWQPKKSRKPPAIILRLHRDFVEKGRKITNQAPVIEDFQKEFKLGAFEISLEKDFGFEPAPFRRQKGSGEFLEFRIAMPAIERPSGRLCPSCNGSGETEYQSTCIRCNGRGKETVLSWTAADATKANLAIFFDLARMNEMETSASKKQIFEIWSGCRDNCHSLGGYYSPAFMRWLDQFPTWTEFPEVEEAMRQTYLFMFHERRRKMLIFDFKAKLLHPGYLTLDCPGDACGIHPSRHGNTSDRGCEFTCHNLDSAAQQLTLLAGLAALHDQVRKE